MHAAQKAYKLGNTSSWLGLAPLLSSSATLPGAAAVSPSLSLTACLQGGRVLLYHLFSRQAVREWLSQSDIGLCSEVRMGLGSKWSPVLFLIVILMTAYYNPYAKPKA